MVLKGLEDIRNVCTVVSGALSMMDSHRPVSMTTITRVSARTDPQPAIEIHNDVPAQVHLAAQGVKERMPLRVK